MVPPSFFRRIQRRIQFPEAFRAKRAPAVVLITAMGVAPLIFAVAVLFGVAADGALEANAGIPFVARPRLEPPPVVRGIYLTSHTAGSDARRNALFALVDRTELNAVVIDIKTSKGEVAYESALSFAREHGLASDAPYDAREILKDAHRRGIWVIARLPVFEDPALAAALPDLALKTRDGTPWRTRKGVAWVDPTNREVWAYAAALARDALRRGFDEVQLDYVRFPSDGNLDAAIYADPSINAGEVRAKAETMREFFGFFRNAVGADAELSADLFGMAIVKAGNADDDLRIGQRLRDALPAFDAVSPMLYPSHYPPTFQGFANPAAHPGEVVAVSLDYAVSLLRGDFSRIRPWLQDFDLGATYTPAMVRVQIDAVEVRGANGWLLWNAANRYTEAALRPADSR